MRVIYLFTYLTVTWYSLFYFDAILFCYFILLCNYFVVLITTMFVQHFGQHYVIVIKCVSNINK